MLILAVLAAGMVPGPRLTTGFHGGTGAWQSITYGRNLAAGVTQDVSVQWEGGRLPPMAGWRLVAIQHRPEETVVVRQADSWEIRTLTSVRGTEIRRRVFLRWLGAEPIVVTSTTLRSPVLRISPAGADQVLLPGNFPIRWVRVRNMRQGETLAEAGSTRGEYAEALVYAPDQRLAVAAAYRFEQSEARIAAVRTGRGVALEHRFHTVARLRPGQMLDVGEQVLRLLRADETSLRAGIAALSDTLNNGPPADTPEDLGRVVLYEVHPWGRLESWNDGDRGHRFERLTRLLPYYENLGINTLWLLPVSWPPPWVYTLPAFNRVAPENGTPDQLRKLVQAAHQRHMRVLLDLVVYGIHPDSDEVKHLPDAVWCKDRQGNSARVWGGTVLAADTSHPTWQRRIAEVVETWAREYGFDGTRLDCVGWGQALNWAADRPDAAITYGGLQLNRVVRDAFRRINPRAVTLPEGGKPLVFRNADMIFDYPLYLAMRDLTWTPNLRRWVTDLQTWLEWERAAYPKRALRGLVRFLELHDTVAAADYFGIGPSQALTAALVFMEGVPLLQQEQEIGYSGDLRRWLYLRNRERCFTHGDASYIAVRSSESRLWTFLRKGDDGAAVVAVNLTGTPLRTTLRWPVALSRRFPTAWNGLTNQRLPTYGNAVQAVVPSYRPLIVLLKPPGWRPLALPKPLTGTRWTVRTAEGLLTDIEQDYATKLRPGESLEDALPTLRRARRVRELGLMDGELPADVRSLPVRIQVSPWFVRLENTAVRLTLARRHGGVPAALERRDRGTWRMVIGPNGDAYTDQGFFQQGLYASADGETNPRLRIERQGNAAVVTFTGTLRQRSWNGVQSCPVASPPVPYALEYRMDESATIRLAMSVSSSVAREPSASAFFALRLPINGLTAWQRGPHQGKAGADRGVRLGQEGLPDEPLILSTAGGILSVRQGNGVSRVFAIQDGERHLLFLALLDGAGKELSQGESIQGQATLDLLPAGHAPRARGTR